ncbi:Xyloglucanase [Podospora pseudocomata]|uniref:Xyloglucanase n=1 Tax=Podospora pseudocomata TaxID=2093779 RepID=A0ABR0GGH6_9PEZI|nr:Xyloglucanase [Podospora pseudocomata]
MKVSSLVHLLVAAVAAPAAAEFSWKNVNIGGGGGFVPGIVFHPTTPGVAYARTDIGGLYRLNPDDSWTPITDSLGTDERWGHWGIDAVALDPQEPNRVYAAVGMYTTNWDPNPGAIIRSDDKGATWVSTDLPFKVGGNMPGRGMGERLAVDPANSNIIYFGARSGNGLWKSTDGGATFSKVTSFTNAGSYIVDPSDLYGYNGDKIGLTFVTFDSTSSVRNGATSRIFVGTADNITASVYVSDDAGATWAPVAGQPTKYFPHKCKLQPTEKALYFTYSDGAGPYDGTSGGVYRYDLTTSTWKDITPVSGGDLFYGFGGLGLDMKKPGTLVVASLNSWWPDAQLFRSTDSGETWSPLWEWAGYPDMNLYYSIHTDKAPWINTGFLSQDSKRLGWMIEALEINPHDSDHWLYGTGLTLFGGHDLTKWDTTRNITIHSLAAGIEEMAVLGLASAPGGSELLAAVGDNNGFTFKEAADLLTSPQTPWMNPMWTSATDVDYAGNKPNQVVRVGNSPGSPQIAISTDGGLTWSPHYGASNTDHSGTLAYSADASTVLWSSGNAGVLRFHTSTATTYNPGSVVPSADSAEGVFTPVDSLPSGAVIAADKRNNSIFYAGFEGTLYRSLDGGATFLTVAVDPRSSTTSMTVVAIKDMVAHPVVAGEVWVSTNIGLLRSTDYGLNYAQVGEGSITNTEQFAFGLGEGGSKWNIYAFGYGLNGPRLYASSDNGESWVDIQGLQGFGAISANRVVGSASVEGQVYVGTNGRGVMFAKGVVEGGDPGNGGGEDSDDDEEEWCDATTTTSAVPTTSSVVIPTTTSTTLVTSVRPTTVSTSSRVTTASTSSTLTRINTTSTSTRFTTTSSAPITQPTERAKRWGQCGGINWTGPKECEAPWTCQKLNDWYFQCL